jgi:hypothetical protein
MDDDFLKEDDEWPVRGRAFGGGRPLLVSERTDPSAAKRSFVA